MLGALKQLIGLEPKDRREVWHDKPVIIADDDDAVRLSAIATVEYIPGAHRYEEGRATVFDPQSGVPLYELDVIMRPAVREALNDQGPFFWLRRSRQGITAEATDAAGEHLRLFAGRSALIFSRNRAAGMFPAESQGTFLNEDPVFTKAELDEFKKRSAAEAWAEEERNLGNPGGELE